MQASKNACKSQKNVVLLHRVRQLKRTELAWRVDSTTKTTRIIIYGKQYQQCFAAINSLPRQKNIKINNRNVRRSRSFERSEIRTLNQQHSARQRREQQGNTI